jgi:hypothetical protein
VVRLRDGSLWVHSPISPTAVLVDELKQIGAVRYLIANRSRHLYFIPFLQAFPSAQPHVAPGLAAKRPELAGYPPIPRHAPWDKPALARSVAPLLSLPVQRVIVAHDQIVDENATEQLARAFAWLG